MNEAGSNVRTIRQQVGMSLRAVAEAACMDPSTLSRIENGKTQLTAELAKKLAAVLHVSVGMFFADAGVLETAMLRIRRAPLLTPQQLQAWRGPDGFEEAPEQMYLHVAIEQCSRFCFALGVTDDANDPAIQAGDRLVFDAQRTPAPGNLVIAQKPDGATFIGRLRPHTSIATAYFDLIPANRFYPEVTSKGSPLEIRGVVVEQRRYF